MITSRPSTQDYRENWQRIFGEAETKQAPSCRDSSNDAGAISHGTDTDGCRGIQGRKAVGAETNQARAGNAASSAEDEHIGNMTMQKTKGKGKGGKGRKC